MKVSVILSVFNEEGNINRIYQELCSVIKYDFELLFVDDGSSDNSPVLIENLCKRDKRVSGIFLSRNFGHEAAMKAGLDNAEGEILIFMDCDLQHPPHLLPELINKFEQGYEIVKPKRIANKKEVFYKRLTSVIFYKFINSLTESNVEKGVSDFFLISKRVSDVLKANYHERIRFFRFLIQNVGFKQISVVYIAEPRNSGASKYKFIQLLYLSFSAFALTSKAPLKFGIFFSIILSTFGILLSLYSLIMKFYANPISGYTTIVILLSFLFSFLFLFLGIIAEYIGIIFEETKNRPNYIINKIIHEKRNNKQN